MGKKFTVDMRFGVYRRLYHAAVRGRRINAVSERAELCFWRLHTVADDLGTFNAEPSMILIDIYPLRRNVTEEDVGVFLRELEDVKLICLFIADGGHYGRILDFPRFQPGPPNGRRIQRFPLPLSVSAPLDSPNREPEPSDSINSKSSVYQDEDEDEGKGQGGDEDEGQSRAPDSPALPPHAQRRTFERVDVQTILSVFPLKKALAGAEHHVRQALVELAQRGESDPVGWLKARVELYRDSDEGLEKPAQARWWFSDKRYDDDPAVWQSKAPKVSSKPGVPAEWNGAPLTAEEKRQREQARLDLERMKSGGAA